MAASILVDNIDLAFVPRPIATVTRRSLGEETLIIDEASGAMYALNPVGSVVWECFDGNADLGVLVEELAEAFNAPLDVVRKDVVTLTKGLADTGLLDGIAHPVAPAAFAGPEVGTELPSFRLPDLGGEPVELTELRGRQVLLVNWSPTCGYCVGVLDELGALRADVEARGAEIVLVTWGQAEQDLALLDEHGVSLRLLVRAGGGDDFEEPFPGMGTPVGYLLDGEGRLAEPAVSGANRVAALARRLAGIDEQAPGTTSGRYLPVDSDSICGPGATGGRKPRVWRPAAAYRIGDYDLGIRTDTETGDRVIARLLAAHLAGADPEVPANYSVVLAAATGGATRDLNLLLAGGMTVVRSRSPRRILLALAAHLSTHLPHEDGGLLRTWNLAAVTGGEAILLPPTARDRLEALQPRLARIGLQIVDDPYATIDPDSLELAVPEPGVALDLAAIDELGEPSPGKTELPRVEPGRYGLRAWFVWGADAPEAEASRTAVASAALTTVAVAPEGLATAFDRLAGLFDRLPILTLQPSRIDQLADQLKPHL